MRRVQVIGAGGAGKSTLARRLAGRLGVPVVHLDAHYWRPGWVPTPDPEWRERVRALMSAPAWVMDGNYSRTMEERFAASDTVLLLDLPRHVCLARIVRRWWRWRGRSRPDVTAGCPETLTWKFVRWVWTYRSRRRPGVLERLSRLPASVRVVILRSDADVEAFLATVPEKVAGSRAPGGG
jgi:adenylate kinase family enzyme